MKKARLKKVLVILIVAIAILLSLSIQGYAETRMMDEAVISTYNALGTEAGIYQTAINCYMDTNRTLDTAIANTRTYYGSGETLKVRFSFSRDVDSVSNLRLGLRFGNGEERVVTNPIKSGSYIIFSYNIAENDFGGLTITFIDGTITDTSGNTISIGILGKENTWTNQIIAKGSWNGLMSYGINFTADEPAYILDGTTIRPIREEDVMILNTSTGESTPGSTSTVSITRDGVAVTEISSSSVIHILNACDIAGNSYANISNITSPRWSVISCTGNQVNGKYYCKAGTKIRFLVMGSTTSKIEIDGASRNLNLVETKASEPSNIYIYEYTIQNGDNGIITAFTDDNFNFNNSYIADTTAPTLTFEGIYLVSGTAYYAETFGAKEPYNSTQMNMGSVNMVTSGTVWAKPSATFNYKWTFEDNYGADKATRSVSAGGWSYSSMTVYIDSLSHRLSGNIYASSFGNCGLWACISDYAGNQSEKYFYSDYITLLSDNTGPEINITWTNTSNSYTNNSSVKFYIQVTDPAIGSYNGSGIYDSNSGTYYGIDISDIVITNGTARCYDTNWDDCEEFYELGIEVIPNGDGYVSIYVPEGVTQDVLGNKSQEMSVEKIYFDTMAPVINDVAGVPTNWTKEATLSVIASDSGVGGIQYSFNGGAYSATNTYKTTKNESVRIKVKDSLGNESEEKIVNVTKIDNIAPTIAGIDQKQTSRYSTEVTIRANDGESGLAEYSFDGGASWQTSPTKVYTESATIGTNQLKVKDRVGNIGTYSGTVSVVVNGSAPIIKLENNGGDFVIPMGQTVSRVHPTIEVDTENNCTIYYAVSQSNTTEPTNYNNIVANKAELNIDLPEGTWYLWTYAIDNTLNLSSTKYVSEAFVVKPAVVFDTTTEGSCISKVEIINGANYVVVPLGTTVSDLLKYIDSPYDVTIKRTDSDKEMAGDSTLITKEIINVDQLNQQYKIVVKGDVIGNGKVGLSDITKLNQYRLNKIALDDAEFLAGDVTGDGKIGLGDITKLNQYRLNKINQL